MTDRPALEKEIGETRRAIAQTERDLRQLRDWLTTNERTVGTMQESLRQITEDGIYRARSDIAQREQDLRQLRETLSVRERHLAIVSELERKQRDISTLEREQERIRLQIERHRAELYQLQNAFDAFARPVAPVVPCELVLPSNDRIPLDAARGSYTLGWGDGSGQRTPDIDLAPFGGGSLGVSRSHAIMRFRNNQWDVEDLDSTNGTFLNDSQISPRVPTLLADKTTIRLGSMRLYFRYVTQTVRL